MEGYTSPCHLNDEGYWEGNYNEEALDCYDGSWHGRFRDDRLLVQHDHHAAETQAPAAETQAPAAETEVPAATDAA